MGLRENLKRRFTKKASDASDGNPPRRKDIEYYKPNEIPKSKYRGKVDKVHQAQLEAYSMEGAFQSTRRRASNAISGTFSPRGTGARSAATSLAPSAVNSRRPSYARERSHLSTANSVSENPDDSPEDSTEQSGAKSNSQDSSPGLISDDTDSPESSAISRSITAADSRNDLTSLSLEKTVTAKAAKEAQFDNHFTAEELEQAMTQASLRSRRGTVLGPVILQPEGISA